MSKLSAVRLRNEPHSEGIEMMTNALDPVFASLAAIYGAARIEAIQAEALGRALTDGEAMIRITVDGAELVPLSEYRARPTRDARSGFTGNLPDLSAPA